MRQLFGTYGLINPLTTPRRQYLRISSALFTALCRKYGPKVFRVPADFIWVNHGIVRYNPTAFSEFTGRALAMVPS